VVLVTLSVVMNATLVVAVLGVVLSTASLVWQFADYLLSGPRILLDGQRLAVLLATCSYTRAVPSRVTSDMYAARSGRSDKSLVLPREGR